MEKLQNNRAEFKARMLILSSIFAVLIVASCYLHGYQAWFLAGVSVLIAAICVLDACFRSTASHTHDSIFAIGLAAIGAVVFIYFMLRIPFVLHFVSGR
jgi:hypothetical protein